MKTLASLLHRIGIHGGRARRDGRLIEILADVPDPLRLRPYLYLLLNRYERDYFIAISGMPVCAMPDAWDHFSRSRRRTSRDGRCVVCRFYASCCGPSRNLVPMPFADIPREVAIEVTTACNLACGICFQTKAEERHLPWRTLLETFKQMRRIGLQHVRFTGGEPLLYPHLEKAVVTAKKLGFHVLLNTNGILMSESKAKFFGRYADSVLVSLRGCDSSSESRLTGVKADFRDKLRRIRSLSSHSSHVRIGTVISRHLIHRLEDYLRILRWTRVSHWELYRPMAASSQQEYRLTQKDFIELIRLLKRYKGPLSIKVANPVPLCLAGDPSSTCHLFLGGLWDDGHTRLVLDARGFYKPSYTMKRDLGTDLLKAWRHPVMRRLHSLEYLPLRCSRCFYASWCKGGSRQWALYSGGSLWVSDPWMPNPPSQGRSRFRVDKAHEKN